MTTHSTKVDAVTTKMSKPKIKGTYYGYGGDHACGYAECPAKLSECHKCSEKAIMLEFA